MMTERVFKGSFLELSSVVLIEHLFSQKHIIALSFQDGEELVACG